MRTELTNVLILITHFRSYSLRKASKKGCSSWGEAESATVRYSFTLILAGLSTAISDVEEAMICNREL